MSTKFNFSEQESTPSSILKSELAAQYGVSYRVFKSWIEKNKDQIPNWDKSSKYLYPAQVEAIKKILG